MGKHRWCGYCKEALGDGWCSRCRKAAGLPPLTREQLAKERKIRATHRISGFNEIRLSFVSGGLPGSKRK